jgi:hypothetical protein
MRRLGRKRPSHGTVVAYLALFVGVATGGAYAVDKIGSNDIAKNAVKSSHIGKGEVRSGDIKPGAATPRAIALVDIAAGDAFFDPKVRKRGFVNVESPEEGVYCITPRRSTGLNPSKDPPLTTIDYGISSEPNAVAIWDSLHDDCLGKAYEINVLHGNSSNYIDNAAFVIRVP